LVHQSGYYPPFERGDEAFGWPASISPEPPPAPQTDNHAAIGISFFENFVFDNPNWEFRTFNWNSDPAYVDNKVVVPGQTLATVLNSIDPDLAKFRAHGGKLIQYHGFSDPEVPPLTSINYFTSVVNLPGGSPGTNLQPDSAEQTQEYYRLFMVPGMDHCSGGPGANVFDMLSPLAFTRPLCPYPQEAMYTGTGDTNDAANFVCKLP
jgi:feruloyl esterase